MIPILQTKTLNHKKFMQLEDGNASSKLGCLAPVFVI